MLTDPHHTSSRIQELLNRRSEAGEIRLFPQRTRWRDFVVSLKEEKEYQAMFSTIGYVNHHDQADDLAPKNPLIMYIPSPAHSSRTNHSS